MGLLSSGTPLAWEKAAQYAEHVRREGIEQLIKIFNAAKDRTIEKLKWGDEVEYIMVKQDGSKRQFQVSVRAEDVLEKLSAEMKIRLEMIPEDLTPCAMSADGFTATWHPEYGRYMLEGTPARPYTMETGDLLHVERDMIARRKQAEAFLLEGEYILSIGNFPRLGCRDAFPETSLSNEASMSLFFPDEYINIHPRFKTLTRNIRIRKDEKVGINLPLYQDLNTKGTLSDANLAVFPNNSDVHLIPKDTILLDAMGLGMGCCCLQITFQARNISEARHLHDQLAVLCPIVLALTASTPIFRGLLSDVDSRWNVISASVDDRTSAEKQHIPKSRYASVSRFIGENVDQSLNDLNCPINETAYKRLIEAGFDDQLAKHFAWLFMRDPLVIYEELLDQNNDISSDHFENIQSTNWQTMRFKPPPAGNESMGWRVEFRPMEVQPTDFENATFSLFIVLLSRVIIGQKLNFYMPISLVDVNMERAQRRDAVLQEKFWFPLDIRRSQIHEIKEMTVNEIINGDAETGYPGLIHLIELYLNDLKVDLETRKRLDEYFILVRQRAAGNLMTPAKWIRRFVQQHPLYMKDSVVSPEINYDLIKEIDRIAHESAYSKTDCILCSHYSKTGPCINGCRQEIV